MKSSYRLAFRHLHKLFFLITCIALIGNGYFAVAKADLTPGKSFGNLNGEDSGASEESETHLINRHPPNMVTLISVAQRDPGVQLFASAARGSGHSIGWEEAIAFASDGPNVLRAPVGDLAADLFILLDEENVYASTLKWFQAPGFPVCDTNSDTTLHLPWNEFIEVGHSSSYELLECATHEKSDIFSVMIIDSQKVPLRPFTMQLSINLDGSIDATTESGFSQGISNLEELTRATPLPTISKRERTIEDLADFIRENLGEDGKEDLALIPKSMGGDGPELEGQEELMDCYLTEGPSGDCGGGATSTD